MNDGDRQSNEEFAAELVGTHLLVGLTHLDHAGNVVRLEQFHGTVIRATVEEGVILVDSDGQERYLPLDREAFRPAEPGEYRLRTTGEVVVDPTWLTTWTISPPKRH
jgi:hypothetical protein